MVDFEAHWNKPLPTNYAHSEKPAIWKRLLAFLIDVLIFDLIIAAPLGALITEFSFQPTPMILAVATVVISLFFGYMVSMQYILGQTVGMMLCKIHVDRTKSLWRYIVRNMYILPFLPFMLLWIIDPIFLLIYKERFSERLSGTPLEAIQ